MKRSVTPILAALDALIVAAAGLALPTVIAAVLAVTRGADQAFLGALRVGADTWLLALGGRVDVVLHPVATDVHGSAAPVSFAVALMPLGLTLLTVLLAARLGQRLARSPMPLIGLGVGAAVFTASAVVTALLTSTPDASVDAVRTAVGALLTYALGAGIGVARAADASIVPARVRDAFQQPVVSAALESFRALGTALLAVTAVTYLVANIAGMGRTIAIAETLHLDVAGAFLSGLAQLALIPNGLVWTLAWLSGGGVQLGGTVPASPFAAPRGTGPLIPSLGAVPDGVAPWAPALIALPVVAVIVAVLGLRFRDRARGVDPSLSQRLMSTGLGAAAISLTVLVLSNIAGGSIGPGRLAHIGPDPLLTFGLVAAIAAIGGLIGALTPLSFILGEVPEVPAAAGVASDTAARPRASRVWLPPRDPFPIDDETERRAAAGASSNSGGGSMADGATAGDGATASDAATARVGGGADEEAASSEGTHPQAERETADGASKTSAPAGASAAGDAPPERKTAQSPATRTSAKASPSTRASVRDLVDPDIYADLDDDA